MSKVQQTDAQKKEARKQQAMRMTVTKVKPVVVKHVLNNQVMDIYDVKVSAIKTLTAVFRRTCPRSISAYLSGIERPCLKYSLAHTLEPPRLTSTVISSLAVIITTTRDPRRKIKIYSKS
jgi:hypothetical protein